MAVSWQEGFGGVSADKDILVGVKLMPVPHQAHPKGEKWLRINWI
jgi:hypothetical protein